MYKDKYGYYFVEKVNKNYVDYQKVKAYLAKKKINSLMCKNSNIIYKRTKCAPYILDEKFKGDK